MNVSNLAGLFQRNGVFQQSQQDLVIFSVDLNGQRVHAALAALIGADLDRPINSKVFAEFPQVHHIPSGLQPTPAAAKMKNAS